MPGPSRVAVFFDYQNAYMGARRAFYPNSADYKEGQFDPMALSQALLRKSAAPRDLVSVRVYRGIPDAQKNPKGYGAAQRQISFWSSRGVHCVPRPLRYPDPWPSLDGEKPQEKGVDVLLAVDFALMAVRGEYDVGILFSADTDLKPAVEEVLRLGREQAGAGISRPVKAEVAAWKSDDPHTPRHRLNLAGQNVYCHWVDRGAHVLTADTSDYTKSRRRKGR